MTPKERIVFDDAGKIIRGRVPIVAKPSFDLRGHRIIFARFIVSVTSEHNGVQLDVVTGKCQVRYAVRELTTSRKDFEGHLGRPLGCLVLTPSEDACAY